MHCSEMCLRRRSFVLWHWSRVVNTQRKQQLHTRCFLKIFCRDYPITVLKSRLSSIFMLAQISGLFSSLAFGLSIATTKYRDTVIQVPSWTNLHDDKFSFLAAKGQLKWLPREFKMTKKMLTWETFLMQNNKICCWAKKRWQYSLLWE